MHRRLSPSGRLTIAALSFVGLASCTDPSTIDTTPHPPDPIDHNLEDCAASAEWIPDTPEMKDSNALFLPAPHPSTECPFYRSAWQTFLVGTKPDAQGEPAIKSFAVIDDLFKKYTPLAPDALAPPGTPRGTSKRAWLGDIKQAGGRQILIDQNGHTLYYGIHVNQTFVDFVKLHGLDSAKAVQDANPNLFFTAGVAEYKTAWQEIDPIPPATDVAPNDERLATFISTKAWVPTLSQGKDAFGNNTILEDRDHPRLITVRLLAIHSVIALPGHPEFIWGSMEHTNADLTKGETDGRAADGHRDIAPVVPEDPVTGELVNPTKDDANNARNTTIVSDLNFPLYHAGTPANVGNKPPVEKDLVFDPATQRFTDPTQYSSIYRMFPASKSNTVDPDDAVTTLNHNVEAIFKDKAPMDKRSHYRLVGAQWMDKPFFFDTNRALLNDESSPLLQNPDKYPQLNQADGPESRNAVLSAGGDTPFNLGIADIAANGSDSAFSMLAGEDRMSSTAMESFTQDPASFFNCFSCHNTLAVTAKGVPFDGPIGDPEGTRLLEPKRINVSHVFSEIILEECTAPENIKLIPGTQGHIATCP